MNNLDMIHNLWETRSREHEQTKQNSIALSPFITLSIAVTSIESGSALILMTTCNSSITDAT